ncbi:phospholipase a-2-activating protein [Moniliophthora roreri MCA 2997]|uniref:Phospholipase a-2-activating protein n=1 Tax=Moniliophthora roreri (strain MCA 2997) TaxID=1381753 RepID=V2X8Y0_MONRO|nr:phospholipase a-2-activating protein [Moniliophthora roreri MCA 2997]
MPYKLSSTLKAHSSDVRAVRSPTSNLILSASRDSTAIAWQRTSTPSSFTTEAIFRASSRYVNAVAYIPPTEDSPKGYIVTGGQDTVINVFNLTNPKDDPDFSLLGHTENVCTLDVAPTGAIVSGSWDRTAKVWKNFNLAYELKGHEQSVWAVLAIDDEQVLTGSADKTVKLWQQHKLISTFKGHTDAVRGLALLPELGFASCSNDSEIRVWTLGGDTIYTLSGHTSFVYSLTILPSGEIVSGGEDRTVRVWKDGECTQVITHPAISVWTVSSMPNGDIVSGCSDGVVRVFSSSEDRWLSAAELKEYEDYVANQALPSQQVGDVKKSDLPGVEALNTPGKKPGEVKMVKNGDKVEAHQWDAGSYSWQKVGDVVDAVGQGRKQLYQGKEYDYVFDVDIQDGVPPLKLPYNATENPYTAAQRFLQSNDLSMNYIDEVAKFIEKNTAGVNLGSGAEEYVDPFTGASRYRSSGGSAPPSASGGEYMDPFTGASRYSGAASTPTAASSNFQDPYTGASRYSGAPSQPTSPSSSSLVQLKLLPMRHSSPFKQANVEGMRTKVFHFNDVLRNEISTTMSAMYPEEISAIEGVFLYLGQVVSDPSTAAQNIPDASSVEAILQVIERWPRDQRFPVIDLARLLAGYCPGAFNTPGTKRRFLKVLTTAAEWNTPWTPPIPKARETNSYLMLRALANIYQDGSAYDKMFQGDLLAVLDQAPYETFVLLQRRALATLLFNMSTSYLQTPFEIPQRNQHLALILRVLQKEKEDSETVYRTVAALGNMLYGMKANKALLSTTQSADIASALQSISQTFRERVETLVKETNSLL